MDRDDLYAQLRDFLAGLAAESGREFPDRLDPDDNLFDLGLVTSFSVIRMILFVEDVTGCPIDLADHEPQAFYTLAGIHTLVASQRQEESA